MNRRNHFIYFHSVQIDIKDFHFILIRIENRPRIAYNGILVSDDTLST